MQIRAVCIAEEIVRRILSFFFSSSCEIAKFVFHVQKGHLVLDEAQIELLVIESYEYALP